MSDFWLLFIPLLSAWFAWSQSVALVLLSSMSILNQIPRDQEIWFLSGMYMHDIRAPYLRKNVSVTNSQTLFLLFVVLEGGTNCRSVFCETYLKPGKPLSGPLSMPRPELRLEPRLELYSLARMMP